MSKEDVRDVVEAMHAVNNDLAEKMTVQLLGLAKSGLLASGLQYVVPASEVRDLLKKRAAKVRGRADAMEKASCAPVERQAGDPLDLGDRLRAQAFSMVKHLREEADRLDWQAAHLEEREYRLSEHDLSHVMPADPPDYYGAATGIDYVAGPRSGLS